MISNIKSDNNIYILLGLLLAIISSVFYASFESLIVMEQVWGAKEEYGYAYMIPFITIYFIWLRLKDLSEIHFKFSFTGALLFLCAMVVILLGLLSATNSITQYGTITAIIAGIYMIFGWAALRVILGPLLLLYLTVPLPVFIYNNLSGYLQLVSSQIGVWVIRLFDISVYLEGNVIDLGIYKLQVVEACSGLRYLFPLFSLSLIAAFLYKAEFWKRTVIVLSSLPITVFMNSFRIGVIGVLVEYGGIEQAEGFLHDFEGWIIFLACTALLIIEMWALLQIGPGSKKLSDAFAMDIPDNSNLNFKSVNISLKHIVTTFVFISLSFATGLVNERTEIIPEREAFSGFPLNISNWTGKRNVISDEILNTLNVNDYIIADYVNPEGKVINFYVAYYESQKSGHAAHSPRSCIPGGGWKIDDLTTTSIDIGTDNNTKTVNRLVIKRGDSAQLVYYWFQQRNRVITNEYVVKWYLFWDALTKRRTDGSLVRLTTSIGPNDSIKSADERLTKFLREVDGLLYKYLPD